MFKIGQKVVCKDNSPIVASPYNDSLRKLRKGEIYTVEFASCGAILLCEVRSSHPTGEFRIDHFEPLKYDLISNMDIIIEMVPERLDVPEKEPAEFQKE